jgi:uncharacterized membrane-anchored protein
MKSYSILAAAMVLLAGTQGFAQAAETESPTTERDSEQMILKRYTWMRGPANTKIKDIAEFKIPEGYMFTDAKGTQELLRLMGNPTSGNELGFFAPANYFSRQSSNGWFVIFEFDKSGYVKDDEKDKLDAAAMLKAIKKGTEYGNREREKMKAPPIEVIGWHTPPRYDAETHNLEWAINLSSEGHANVNYNTRLLGRTGVMEASLVVEPENLEAILPIFKDYLKGYSFASGQKYAEYRPGDKVAQYGLAALIVGGAAAGAAKLGLFAWAAVLLKKFWKLIVLAVVAVSGFLSKLLGFRRSTTQER